MKKIMATLATLLTISAVPAQAETELARAFPPIPAPSILVPSEGPGIGGAHWRLSGRMQNIFLWRNDSDFDRTPPYYDAHGQSVGLVGTFFAPRLDIMPSERLRMVAEVELGLNIWSLQDADAYDIHEPGFLRLAMRQLFMEGTFFNRALSFRAGYERVFDLSGLFMGHWIGAATLATAHSWGVLSLTAGQLPDQTHEGVAFDSTNFNADTIVYGLRGDFPLGAYLLSASLWGLTDRQVVDQRLDLMTFTVRLGGLFENELTRISFGLDAGVQYGTTSGRAAGHDERTLAWSAQGTLDAARKLRPGGGAKLLLFANVMALSGDDDHDGNEFNGAWFYSGRSRSRTMLLTEDLFRDRGGSIDRRMSEPRHGDHGKFYLLRSGLLVADLSVGAELAGFFRPFLTAGVGLTMNPENALGSRFVGFETDLHLEFFYRDLLTVNLVQSVLLPGQAAAAFVNRTGDRQSTDPIYQIQVIATMYF